MRHTAYTYSTLIASIKELRRLRDLDSGEKLDPRDKIRATGGRVGLGVPKVSWRLLSISLPLFMIMEVNAPLLSKLLPNNFLRSEELFKLVSLLFCNTDLLFNSMKLF